ncbi:MAG: alkaline phosphatase family protein [Candidatus Eremiobacteraeota bacterium]|nr:alkaline phosphatase family protein [Candidatus Eremiobacteraeota bacterium]
MLAQEWPSADELIRNCRSSVWGDVLPHPSYNVCALRALFENAFDSSSPGSLLGRSESVLVLVVDGVSFDVARDVWSPTWLRAVTSTCPSTTSTALLSATTGLSPAAHGVVGVAFRAAQTGATFNCYSDGPAPDDFSLGPWPTVFSGMSERVDCVAHVGSLATIPGRWSRAVVHGARAVLPSADWNAIDDDPAAMVNTVVGEIEATLAQPRSRPLFVWAHVNLDSAIHRRGYDPVVRDAVAELGRAAARWAGRGHTVIAHADHGLVEIRDSDRARRLLELLNDPASCEARSGGAGRIIWAYPRPGSALLERARTLAEDFAAVIGRDELFASGAVAETPAARERIGDVVVVATGSEFPKLVPENRFEHGAFSATEMIVPVAVWMSE